MKTRTFVITDPREYAGDPYEVAERAVAQAQSLAAILTDVIGLAEIMARNAQMSRNIKETPHDARADEWLDDPQHRHFFQLRSQSDKIEQRLGLLRQAAAFKP